MNATGQPEALCGIGINFRADKTGALLVSSLIEGGISHRCSFALPHSARPLSTMRQILSCSLPFSFPRRCGRLLLLMPALPTLSQCSGSMTKSVTEGSMTHLSPAPLSSHWRQDRLGNQGRFKKAMSCTRLLSVCSRVHGKCCKGPSSPAAGTHTHIATRFP